MFENCVRKQKHTLFTITKRKICSLYFFQQNRSCFLHTHRNFLVLFFIKKQKGKNELLLFYTDNRKVSQNKREFLFRQIQRKKCFQNVEIQNRIKRWFLQHFKFKSKCLYLKFLKINCYSLWVIAVFIHSAIQYLISTIKQIHI